MNICKTITNYLRIRRIEKELSLLSDRDLNDIGICRCDISRIARSKESV